MAVRGESLQMIIVLHGDVGGLAKLLQYYVQGLSMK